MCAHQITVSHPAAKSLIEIARTQDEQVGDGTTSVVILGIKHCIIMDIHWSIYWSNITFIRMR